MEDERPPRLRYDMETVILGKDTKEGVVLLGGLGCMGVGRMWFYLQSYHLDLVGWNEAPEVEYKPK
jgi:hypothetical protein